MQENDFEELLEKWFDAMASQAPAPPTLEELRKHAMPWWKRIPLRFDAAREIAGAEGLAKEPHSRQAVSSGDPAMPALLLDEKANPQVKTTARIAMSELDGTRLRLRLTLDQPLLGAESAQVTICKVDGTVCLDVFAEMPLANEIVVDQCVSGEEAAFGRQLHSQTGLPIYALIKVDQPAGG